MKRILAITLLYSLLLSPSKEADIYFAYADLSVAEEQVRGGIQSTTKFWGIMFQSVPDLDGTNNAFGLSTATSLRNAAIDTNTIQAQYLEQGQATIASLDQNIFDLDLRSTLAKQYAFFQDKDITFKIGKLTHASAFPSAITNSGTAPATKISYLQGLINRQAQVNLDSDQFTILTGIFDKTGAGGYPTATGTNRPAQADIFPTPAVDVVQDTPDTVTVSSDGITVDSTVTGQDFQWSLAGVYAASTTNAADAELFNKFDFSDHLDLIFETSLLSLKSSLPWQFGFRCEQVKAAANAASTTVDLGDSSVTVLDQMTTYLNANTAQRDIAMQKSYWFSSNSATYGVPSFGQLFPEYGYLLQSNIKYAYKLASALGLTDIAELKSQYWTSRRVLQGFTGIDDTDAEGIAMSESEYETYLVNKFGFSTSDIKLLSEDATGATPVADTSAALLSSVGLTGQSITITAANLLAANANAAVYIMKFSVTPTGGGAAQVGYFHFTVFPAPQVEAHYVTKIDGIDVLQSDGTAFSGTVTDDQDVKVGFQTTAIQNDVAGIQKIRHGWLSDILDGTIPTTWATATATAIPATSPFNLPVNFPVFGGEDVYVVQAYGLKTDAIGIIHSTKAVKVQSADSRYSGCRKTDPTALLDYFTSTYPSPLTITHKNNLITQAATRYIDPTFPTVVTTPVDLSNITPPNTCVVPNSPPNTPDCNGRGTCTSGSCGCDTGYSGDYCLATEDQTNAPYYLTTLNDFYATATSKDEAIKAYAYILNTYSTQFDTDSINGAISVLAGVGTPAIHDITADNINAYVDDLESLALESSRVNTVADILLKATSLRNAIYKVLSYLRATAVADVSGTKFAEAKGLSLSVAVQVFNGDANADRSLETANVQSIFGVVLGSVLTAPLTYSNPNIYFHVVTMSEILSDGLVTVAADQDKIALALITQVVITDAVGPDTNLGASEFLSLKVGITKTCTLGFAYQPVNIVNGAYVSVGNVITPDINDLFVTFQINSAGLYTVIEAFDLASFPFTTSTSVAASKTSLVNLLVNEFVDFGDDRTPAITPDPALGTPVAATIDIPIFDFCGPATQCGGTSIGACQENIGIRKCQCENTFVGPYCFASTAGKDIVFKALKFLSENLDAVDVDRMDLIQALSGLLFQVPVAPFSVTTAQVTTVLTDIVTWVNTYASTLTNTISSDEAQATFNLLVALNDYANLVQVTNLQTFKQSTLDAINAVFVNYANGATFTLGDPIDKFTTRDYAIVVQSVTDGYNSGTPAEQTLTGTQIMNVGRVDTAASVIIPSSFNPTAAEYTGKKVIAIMVQPSDVALQGALSVDNLSSVVCVYLKTLTTSGATLADIPSNDVPSMSITVALQSIKLLGQYRVVLIDTSGETVQTGVTVTATSTTASFSISKTGCFAVEPIPLIEQTLNQNQIATLLDIIKEDLDLNFEEPTRVTAPPSLAVNAVSVFCGVGNNCNNVGTCGLNTAQTARVCTCNIATNTDPFCLSADKVTTLNLIAENVVNTLTTTPNSRDINALAAAVAYVSVSSTIGNSAIGKIVAIESITTKDDLIKLNQAALSILKSQYVASGTLSDDLKLLAKNSYDTIVRLAKSLAKNTFDNAVNTDSFEISSPELAQIFQKPATLQNTNSPSSGATIDTGNYKQISTTGITNGQILVPESELNINILHRAVTTPLIIDLTMKNDDTYAPFFNVTKFQSLVTLVNYLNVDGDTEEVDDSTNKSYLTLYFKQIPTGTTQVVPILLDIETGKGTQLAVQTVIANAQSVTFQFQKNGYYTVATKADADATFPVPPTPQPVDNEIEEEEESDDSGFIISFGIAILSLAIVF